MQKDKVNGYDGGLEEPNLSLAPSSAEQTSSLHCAAVGLITSKPLFMCSRCDKDMYFLKYMCLALEI